MRSTSKAGGAFTRALLPLVVQVHAAAKAVAASRWASPLGRVALFAAGLVLLAVIGNSALAKGPKAMAAVATPPPVDTSTQVQAAAGVASDAGALENAMAAPPTATQAPSPARETGAHGRATPDDPVVLNSASVEDFQRLPGVGPKRARAIFDLRAHIGKFRHVEDLLRVKGIGRSTLKKLRPLVRLDTVAVATPVTSADAGAP